MKSKNDTDKQADMHAQKVLHTCLDANGRFKRLPAKPKQLLVLLNHMAQGLQAGKLYSEHEINQLVARFHDDISGLRRDMIDAGILARKVDGSVYWLVERQ